MPETTDSAAEPTTEPAAEAKPAEVVVRYRYADGILLEGDTYPHRNEVKKAYPRWRWFRSLRKWGVPRTRERALSRYEVEEYARGLTKAGVPNVRVDYQEPRPEDVRDFDEVLEERKERALARADWLEERADRHEAKAAEEYGKHRAVLDRIPMGQPILVGHHSEGRHRRDLKRADDSMRRSVEATRDAERARRGASSAKHSVAREESPRFALRRVLELAKEARELEVKITGETPSGWRGHTPSGPATGNWLARLRTAAEENRQKAEHYRRVLDEKGYRPTDSTVLRKGDRVLTDRGYGVVLKVLSRLAEIRFDNPVGMDGPGLKYVRRIGYDRVWVPKATVEARQGPPPGPAPDQPSSASPSAPPDSPSPPPAARLNASPAAIDPATIDALLADGRMAPIMDRIAENPVDEEIAAHWLLVGGPGLQLLTDHGLGDVDVVDVVRALRAAAAAKAPTPAKVPAPVPTKADAARVDVEALVRKHGIDGRHREDQLLAALIEAERMGAGARLAQLVRSRKLESVPEHIVTALGRARGIVALERGTWPPPPQRGDTYDKQEFRGLLQSLDRHPAVVELLDEANAWPDRMQAIVGSQYERYFPPLVRRARGSVYEHMRTSELQLKRGEKATPKLARAARDALVADAKTQLGKLRATLDLALYDPKSDPKAVYPRLCDIDDDTAKKVLADVFGVEFTWNDPLHRDAYGLCRNETTLEGLAEAAAKDNAKRQEHEAASRAERQRDARDVLEVFRKVAARGEVSRRRFNLAYWRHHPEIRPHQRERRALTIKDKPSEVEAVVRGPRDHGFSVTLPKGTAQSEAIAALRREVEKDLGPEGQAPRPPSTKPPADPEAALKALSRTHELHLHDNGKLRAALIEAERTGVGAQRLARYVRANGLHPSPQIISQAVGHARGILALENDTWPPPPLRGEVYGTDELRGVYGSLDHHPAVVELVEESDAWPDRMKAIVGERYQRWFPSLAHRAKSAVLDYWQSFEIKIEGQKATRKHLAAAGEVVVAYAKKQLEQLRFLLDPSLYDPRSDPNEVYPRLCTVDSTSARKVLEDVFGVEFSPDRRYRESYALCSGTTTLANLAKAAGKRRAEREAAGAVKQAEREADARDLVAVHRKAAALGDVTRRRFNLAYWRRHPELRPYEREKVALTVRERSYGMVEAKVRGPRDHGFYVELPKGTNEQDVIAALMREIETHTGRKADAKRTATKDTAEPEDDEDTDAIEEEPMDDEPEDDEPEDDEDRSSAEPPPPRDGAAPGSLWTVEEEGFALVAPRGEGARVQVPTGHQPPLFDVGKPDTAVLERMRAEELAERRAKRPPPDTSDPLLGHPANDPPDPPAAARRSDPFPTVRPSMTAGTHQRQVRAILRNRIADDGPKGVSEISTKYEPGLARAAKAMAKRGEVTLVQAPRGYVRITAGPKWESEEDAPKPKGKPRPAKAAGASSKKASTTRPEASKQAAGARSEQPTMTADDSYRRPPPSHTIIRNRVVCSTHDFAPISLSQEKCRACGFVRPRVDQAEATETNEPYRRPPPSHTIIRGRVVCSTHDFFPISQSKEQCRACGFVRQRVDQAEATQTSEPYRRPPPSHTIIHGRVVCSTHDFFPISQSKEQCRACGFVRQRPELDQGSNSELEPTPPRVENDATPTGQALASEKATAEPVARLEFVDVATGVPADPSEPGTLSTGRIVAEIEGETVEIDEEDLLGHGSDPDPRKRRYRFDADSPADYPGQARAKKAAREASKVAAKKGKKAKGARAGLRATFDSPAKAAAIFYEHNEDFFDNVVDPWDGLRDWMDGIEARVGRGHRKLAKTPAGRRILEEKHAARAIRGALAYLMGQAKGRRWEAVPWEQVERLGEALMRYFEAPSSGPGQPGLYWRPFTGTVRAEDLDAMTPEQRVSIREQESVREIGEALEELREAYERAKDCLPDDVRRVIERRIAQWSQWVEDPSKIPDYACEPDPASAGYLCNYPAVAGELAQLRRSCEDAYDPNWAAKESKQGAPGFPDTSGGEDEDPPPRKASAKACCSRETPKAEVCSAPACQLAAGLLDAEGKPATKEAGGRTTKRGKAAKAAGQTAKAAGQTAKAGKSSAESKSTSAKPRKAPSKAPGRTSAPSRAAAKGSARKREPTRKLTPADRKKALAERKKEVERRRKHAAALRRVQRLQCSAAVAMQQAQAIDTKSYRRRVEDAAAAVKAAEQDVKNHERELKAVQRDASVVMRSREAVTMDRSLARRKVRDARCQLRMAQGALLQRKRDHLRAQTELQRAIQRVNKREAIAAKRQEATKKARDEELALLPDKE